MYNSDQARESAAEIQLIKGTLKLVTMGWLTYAVCVVVVLLVGVDRYWTAGHDGCLVCHCSGWLVCLIGYR